MKVAITAAGDSLDSLIDTSFERAPYFVIMELNNPSGYQIIPNPNSGATSYSAILSAQMLINLGVEMLVADVCDPSALRIFEAADVLVYEAARGTVRQFIGSLSSGKQNLTNLCQQLYKNSSAKLKSSKR